MSRQQSKKLVYVLNYVGADDSQHYVHVLRLIERLRELGWSVVLISEKGAKGTKNVLGHDVRYMSRRGGLWRLVRLATTLASLRIQGYRLVFVRISKPAALVSICVGWIIGIRTLFWLSTTNHDLNLRRPILYRVWDDLILSGVVKGALRFVTGPEHMIRYYRDTYRVPQHKLTLLYNDVDLDRFNREVLQRPVGDATTRIVFVHSLSPSKAAKSYMPAILARLKTAAEEGLRVEVDLIGDGPERREIAGLVQEAGEGVVVRLRGAVPNREIPKYLAAADLYIMPSYREGMPRALLEAMAMGLPAVATDAGGTRDIVGPLQQKFVVSRDDREGFADRVLDLLRDRASRVAIGMENQTWVQRYSTQTVAEMYDKTLSGLL